ncbi:MAG: hypothetical protein K0U52_12745, partial [Gammaproteobacteria bacterium]|nr:hypothetical protein [Gammaproteobacteria bacterium]
PQVFERNIPILLIKVKAELDRFDTGSITQDAIAEAFRQTMVDSRDDRDAQEPTRLLAVFVKKLDVLIDQESRRMLTEDHEEAQVVARAFP